MQFGECGSPADGPNRYGSRRLGVEELEKRAVPAGLVDLIEVEPGPTHVTQIREGATPYTSGTGYTFRLSTTPTAPVTITLVADDSRMFYKPGGAWSSTEADTFVLSPSDLSEYVDILAAEDTNVNGTVVTSVDVIVSSEDPRFNGVLEDRISLTVLDNDFLVTNTADSGPGSLRQAVSDIQRNWGTIRFAENLSGQTIRLNDQISAAGGVSIDASALPNGITITPSFADASHRFIETTGGLTLANLTIKGFRSDGNGGAVLSYGWELRIDDCVFENNVAVRGGAIAIYNGYAEISNTRFGGNMPDAGNRASVGGGAILVGQRAGWVNVRTSTFSNNTSAAGGGAIWNFGFLSLRQTELVANHALSNGGAILSSNEFRLTESTLFENRANAGGGVYVAGGNAVVLNSTLSANNSQTDGGGVLVANGQVAIIATTITGNHAALHGGGISTSSSTAATLNNSIVAGNTIGPTEGQSPSDLAGLAPKTSYTLIADPASALGLQHGENGNIIGKPDSLGVRQILPVDEILLPLANHGGPTRTHALRPESVAINQGLQSAIPLTSFYMPSTDQRGASYARVIGASMDMGAVEFQRWRNVESPTDVNDDGHITAQDALNIINELHLRRYSDSSGVLSPMSVNGVTQFYYDVNGDGYVTAVDALLVINRLHRMTEGSANELTADTLRAVESPEGEFVAVNQVVWTSADGLSDDPKSVSEPSADELAAAQWFVPRSSRESKKGAVWPMQAELDDSL